MAGMTVTTKRNMSVNFADPYIVIGQSILLNPKLKDKIKSYKDLNNAKYTVVSKLGTTGEQVVKKKISNEGLFSINMPVCLSHSRFKLSDVHSSRLVRSSRMFMTLVEDRRPLHILCHHHFK